jgi:hypothetical protein
LYGHTATLLANGKVLIAGVTTSAGPVAAAELYDPATGTFSGTGDMTRSRSGHAAALLANGKVLVAGQLPLAASSLTCLSDGKVLIQGFGRDGAFTAGIYDPDVGTFSPVAQLANRYAPPARGTLLLSGKVLDTALTWPVDDANWAVKLYDPSTTAFADERMAAVREHGFTTTLLSDGTILIAGGGDTTLPSN